MFWLFVLLSALITFVVAAVAVGSVTADQATKSRAAVYDLNDAVEFVADRLPAEVTATIGYDDVRQVLLWHLDYLEKKGVASYGAAADVSTALVVVNDDEPVAYILGRADEEDHEIEDAHVAAILIAQEDYYRLIGAFGPRVDGPADPGGDRDTFD